MCGDNCSCNEKAETRCNCEDYGKKGNIWLVGQILVLGFCVFAALWGFGVV